MFQQFFTDTLESRFIKALLCNTPVPLYDTVRDGDYIVKGCIYIYQASIMKALSSGYVRYAPEEEQVARFRNIGSYIFGDDETTFTEKYISNYHYYDSETHKHLGDYLRCLRDIKGLNLMPLYNCFNETYTDSYYLLNKGIATGKNSKYKVVKVPIKFNRTYTIAIDSSSTVLMMPALLDNDNLMTIVIRGVKTELNPLLSINTPVQYPSLSFKFPVTFRLPNDNEVLQRYENDLYLLIQLSYTNDSSIVVLEGDYTDNRTEVICDFQNDAPGYLLDKVCKSQLSLLQFNDRNTYAFSNKMIEYLLLNVICQEDELYDNIEWAQIKLRLPDKSAFTYGLWNDYTRIKAFRDYMYNSKNIKLDKFGYIDKEVENYLRRKSVY